MPYDYAVFSVICCFYIITVEPSEVAQSSCCSTIYINYVYTLRAYGSWI